MRLASFSVTNYRSITSAHRLPLSDATILLGQNNEGKSNLLSALAAAMSVVSQLARRRIIQGRLRITHRMYDRPYERYNWERDFPISLQESQPDGESIFRLEFLLSAQERTSFKHEVHSDLNEALPIEIRLGKRDPGFKVVKQGPGKEALNSKVQQIADFIGKRVEFSYIPAVRTADAAIEVVKDMVERELRQLEEDPAYRALVQQVSEAQKPVLKAISQKIGISLKEFIPQIRSVSIRASEDTRYSALRRSVDITVDDGTPTSLERKGDGVQSLAAISLMRDASVSTRALILALEEPESHLHPSAIHRLREVIDELSHRHQVVLTTHCPLFVDRAKIEKNIIVSENRAKPAKSIAEIRETLGVRASDNLIHANLVLITEGETDSRAIRALFLSESTVLRSAIRNSHIVIDHLGGNGKLSYRLSELRNILCGSYVFFDYDESSRRIADGAVAEGLIKASEVSYATCPGKKESEWEDLVNVDIYKDWVRDTYGIVPEGPLFQNTHSWSKRMADLFHRDGRDWNERVKKDVKTYIAQAIEKNPKGALNHHVRASFDSLKSALESRIQKKREG